VNAQDFDTKTERRLNLMRDRIRALTDALVTIRDCRDLLAEGGDLPPPYQAFDDWAADLADEALDGAS
jgi:hypothetical protein